MSRVVDGFVIGTVIFLIVAIAWLTIERAIEGIEARKELPTDG